jgi:hypothetical protein
VAVNERGKMFFEDSTLYLKDLSEIWPPWSRRGKKRVRSVLCRLTKANEERK